LRAALFNNGYENITAAALKRNAAGIALPYFQLLTFLAEELIGIQPLNIDCHEVWGLRRF